MRYENIDSVTRQGFEWSLDAAFGRHLTLRLGGCRVDVRDELRDGKTLPASVEHGWSRARRTILASDSVSFLAAMVLYVTAVGNVKGFAFTLGLTTIVDLIVVMLFTHPMLGMLAQTKFFGRGHPWSGLDPRQLGRESFYKGRGRVAVAEMTLAERKAAARAAAATTQEGNK